MSADEQVPAPGVPKRILDWLRAGYPEGIDPRDFPAVLGVLRRTLAEHEIDEIAGDLAVEAAKTGEPIAAEDIHEMVRQRAFQDASAEDLFRVSARLAAGGWPLSTKLD